MTTRVHKKNVNDNITPKAVRILIWLYVELCFLVWYIAPFLPQNAHIAHLVTNVLSDIIWIPAGIFLWTEFFLTIGLRVLKNKRKSVKRLYNLIVFSFICLAFMPLYSHAFRWLFLPIGLLVARCCLGKTLKRQGSVSVTSSVLIPKILFFILFICYYGWQLVPDSRPSDSSGTVKVLTANIYSKAGSEGRNELFEALEYADADIVCLTEYNPQDDPPLFENNLLEMYPYRLTNRSEKSWRSGEIIMSKSPINSLMQDNSTDENYILGEISVKSAKIAVLNVHLVRTVKRVDSVANNWQRFADGLKNTDSIRELKEKQIAQLWQVIDGVDQPLIICGDFNDTPNSRLYRMMSRYHTDAFAEAGWGLGGSFGKDRLTRWLKNAASFAHFFEQDYLRIDYIFSDNELKPEYSEIITLPTGSDHKPVVAILRLDFKAD